MSKNIVLIIAVIGVILAAVALGLWAKDKYNSMVVMDEQVNAAWAQVENQYQRRADLIPNLVNTVKGYAAHERETLEAVINARANATKTTIEAGALTPENFQQFQAAQGELSSALSRLMVVVERYPDLKANESFRELQVQLEGTENRIAVERMRFNETAQTYNTYIRNFPNNLAANIFGFEQKPYFASRDGAENAPVVDFSDTPPQPAEASPEAE